MGSFFSTFIRDGKNEAWNPLDPHAKKKDSSVEVESGGASRELCFLKSAHTRYIAGQSQINLPQSPIVIQHVACA